jgi:hypothetical protein
VSFLLYVLCVDLRYDYFTCTLQCLNVLFGVILEVCQLILIAFVAAYTMSINDLTIDIQLSPTSHIHGYKQKSDSNPAEVAREQTNPLLNHMSDRNGKVLKLISNTNMLSLIQSRILNLDLEVYKLKNSLLARNFMHSLHIK